ncbi:hypothetical protein GGU11DRAFT_761147 [Lentinula aff. detonsa]|nr:hypothetical protein GGU11DRAFT_761147 [Lentinula aff. detonsa]
MHNNAKASSSKRHLDGNGDDERRRPRKSMDDRRHKRLTCLRQKLRKQKVIVEKEKGKEQRDEEHDEERRKKLLPIEEPPMPLASRSDFPSDHWVEPIEEELRPLPQYPEHHVSVMIPPLPSSSPPAEGPVIVALRIPWSPLYRSERAKQVYILRATKDQMRGQQNIGGAERSFSERQERIENDLVRIARMLEARDNEAIKGSEGKEGEEKDEGDVEE